MAGANERYAPRDRRNDWTRSHKPSRPGSYFPGHMSLAPQTVDELQNAAIFGFENGFHDQLTTARQDAHHNRFRAFVPPIYLMSRLIAVGSLGEW